MTYEKTSFDERLDKEKKSKEIFEYFLKKKNIEFAKTGYEHWQASEEFKELVRNRNDQYACQIRFNPDYTVVSDDSIWNIEVKSNYTIEKIAYETYLQKSKLSKVGIVVIKNEENGIWFTDITDIILKITEQPQNFIQVPVEDEFWLNPRKLSIDLYKKWKVITGGSGCAYASISKPKSNFIRLD
jgi:hypothetical protein